MINQQRYHSPFGELLLASYENKLVLCDWKYRKMRESIDRRITKGLNTNYIQESSPVIEQTIQELEEYFNHKRRTFTVPVHFVGTNFQQQVWRALQQIPFGETQSYLGLSRLLGNEKAIRAVASANGANALSILIPCHRIIGNNKELTGYAGGLTAKKKLLTLENPKLFQKQLDLFNE